MAVNVGQSHIPRQGTLMGLYPFVLKQICAEEHDYTEEEGNMGWDRDYLFFSH